MSKPNILMIMADQLRADWISCSGTTYVDTPNIDTIAEKGIRFTRAACNSPLCAPSRAALAAGIYAHRMGVLDNTVNFPLEQPTYYQALRRAGYRVGVVGKTDLHKPEHFYGQNGDRPLLYHLGFTDPIDTEGKMNASKFGRLEYQDNYDGKLVGPYQLYLKAKGLLDDFVKDYRKRLREYPVWYAAESVLSSEDYHDAYIGEKACEFIRNVSDESPWHLFVSFVGPHDPWDAPKEYYALHKDRSFPDSIKDEMIRKPEWVKEKSMHHSGRIKTCRYNRVKQHYAGMISLIDDWVGKILNELDKRGLSDNTIIIFCADHGEMMGDHGLFQKSVMYEGALRIPLIILDPRLNTSSYSDALVEQVDLFPTILDLVEVNYNKDKLDGKSLVSILKGETKNHKHYQLSELGNCRMIFNGRYKLIENFNDIFELYDLQEDPHELINIAEDEPDIVKEMLMMMREVRR